MLSFKIYKQKRNQLQNGYTIIEKTREAEVCVYVW